MKSSTTEWVRKKGTSKKLAIKAAIKRLENLAKVWPCGISLFSANGCLYVVEDKTNKILEQISIPNEGGDPGSEIRSDGEEYLTLE